MSGWPLHTIRDVACGLFDGPHATPAPADEGPVFLGIGNVTEDGHLDLSNVRHIAEGDFEKWTKRVTPQAGDIVFTYEATLNRYAIIPEGFRGCLGRRMALIRPDIAKVDTCFLFYSFFSSEWRDTIEANRLSGATVDRIPLTKFPDFPIRLPPLDIQRRVASILGVYDDLIEVNRRRVAMLEEMARGLFEEWFVRFHYPGHENVPIVDTPEGRLPNGWEHWPFSALAHFINGFAFKPSHFELDGLPIVKIPELRSGVSAKTPRNSGVDVPSRLHIQNGDLLFSWSGTLAISEWTGGAALLNQHLFLVVPKQEFGRGFIKQALISALPRFDSQGVGATMKHIRRSALDNTMIAVPTGTALAEQADRLLQTSYDQLVVLRRQNQNLAASRDLLLPRLISGQLSVPAAERELEVAA